MPKPASVLATTNDRGLPPEEVLFGSTRAMQEIREKLEKFAGTTVPILIRGESGTGKELIAQLIHRKSALRSGPFVKITCPAIPGTPIESELFSQEKQSQAGLDPGPPEIAKRAAGGTLFLDEIGDLDKGLQGKLLRLLQDGQFAAPEGRHFKPFQVRVICAASRNLEQDIKKEAFRPDLFYRVNVASVDLPALRDRRSDIRGLVDYFLGVYTEKFQCRVEPISNRTIRLFEEFSWPGNIRELENLIKRYVILGSETELHTLLEDSQKRAADSVTGRSASMSLKKITKQASRDLEREIILQVLAENHWNRRQTARTLDISYRALLYKLKDACAAVPRVPGGKETDHVGHDAKESRQAWPKLPG